MYIALFLAVVTGLAIIALFLRPEESDQYIERLNALQSEPTSNEPPAPTHFVLEPAVGGGTDLLEQDRPAIIHLWYVFDPISGEDGDIVETTVGLTTLDEFEDNNGCRVYLGTL